MCNGDRDVDLRIRVEDRQGDGTDPSPHVEVDVPGLESGAGEVRADRPRGRTREATEAVRPSLPEGGVGDGGGEARGEAFDTGDALIREAVRIILKEGEKAAPRGLAVRELTRPVVLTLKDVHRPFLASPVRRPNYRFGLAEACWILSGSDDAQLIAKFNKNMLNYSDDGKTMWGAYGPRLMGQLPHVLATLKRDPDSRQAIALSWRPQVAGFGETSHFDESLHEAGIVDLDYGSHLPEWDGASWLSKDIPCTISWHFMIRSGRLSLTVFMRSNDVWLGLPYDLLSFTTVQRVVASYLGVEPGPYHHVVSNLHLYEPQFEDAERLMQEVSGNPNDLKRFVLPSFDRIFHFAPTGVTHIKRIFKEILDGKCPYGNDQLKPFRAAIDRDPSLWDGWQPLMRSNGWRVRD